MSMKKIIKLTESDLTRIVKRIINESLDDEYNTENIPEFDEILSDFIQMAENGDFFLVVEDFVKRERFEYGKKSGSPYGEPKKVSLMFNPPHIITIIVDGRNKDFGNVYSMMEDLRKKYRHLDIIMGGNLTQHDIRMGIGNTIEIRPPSDK